MLEPMPWRIFNKPCQAGNTTIGGKRGMDVAKILVELRQEREQIEEAILSLERLARGRGRRRGRPPSWMAEITAKRRGRPPGSKNKNSAKSLNATTMG
jgi:DNA invertase Pin-like site-specific DNA recombinase